MKTKAYLFNADGINKEVEITDDICRNLEENQLLWVNISERDEETIKNTVEAFRFKNAPVKMLLDEQERPNLDKFENFYRLFINSVSIDEKNRLRRVPIDFLVANNIVISIQNGEVDYFERISQSRRRRTAYRRIGYRKFSRFAAGYARRFLLPRGRGDRTAG